jgi:response regulator of citrate/malate metabolism
VSITESQLLDALRAALPEQDDAALTTEEIAAALDISHDKARRLMKGLARSGKIEVVRKRILDLAGRNTPVPAYRPAA